MYNIWHKQIILDICINIFWSSHLSVPGIQRNIEQVRFRDMREEDRPSFLLNKKRNY
jgi:hypothetical protein